MTMMRPVIALVSLVMAVILVGVLLGSLHHQGHISLPMDELREWFQWEQIRAPLHGNVKEVWTDEDGEDEGEIIPPFDDYSVRIYIGVVTAWWKHGTRAILREAYHHFPRNGRSTDLVTIEFILGKPPSNDTASLTVLQWEQERFGDIRFVDMEENMNDGKSYEYLYMMGKMYNSDLSREERPYDYLMKVDDDAFIHLPNLLEKLRPMRRHDLWLGRGGQNPHFMFGSGYIFSWDIVTWLADNRADLSKFLDPYRYHEDQCIAAMIRWSNKTTEWWTGLSRAEYADYPGTELQGNKRTPMTNKMVLVHRVKTPELLAHAIQCFTGTGSCKIKKSKKRDRFWSRWMVME